MDSDDEVRDRATFYMNVLQQKQKALNAAYIFNGKVCLLGLLFLTQSIWLCRWLTPCAALRSVRVRPWTGEVSAPVHAGAL